VNARPGGQVISGSDLLLPEPNEDWPGSEVISDEHSR
jgi:hypothetical protein